MAATICGGHFLRSHLFMPRSIARICQVVLLASILASLGSLASGQQPRQVQFPTDQPFIAVHTFAVGPGDERRFLAAIREINAAIAQAGCPSCIYHEFKTSGQQSGPFNYMQVSYWPSGDMYVKVHSSPDYVAVTKRWNDVLALPFRAETYNRYVEVKP